jgi:hypothetical protein
MLHEERPVPLPCRTHTLLLLAALYSYLCSADVR